MWWIKLSNPEAKLPLAKLITNPVFVWGRPWGLKLKGNSHVTNLYLMVLDGDQLDQLEPGEDVDLTRLYFTGTPENPKWEAGPEVEPTVLISGAEDIPYINHMSVAYNPHLGLWVMLYGGSTLPKLYEWAEDNPEERRVYMRVSKTPWGPWSEKKSVYPRESDLELRCRTLYEIGKGEDLQCTPAQSWEGPLPGKLPQTCASFCVDFDNMDLAHIEDQNKQLTPGEKIPGFEYGTLLWAGAHYKYEDETRVGSTFYFLMSTFNPYHVVLMKATIAQPK